MSRFYFNHHDATGNYLIFDRQWSNTTPIATTGDVNVAEMVCQALNSFWERPQ